VLGVDIGATSTTAVLLDPAGTVIGRGAAAGANPNAHPVDVAAARLADAIRAALGGRDPRGVGGCVLGMAGVSRWADPVVATAFVAAVRDTGVPHDPAVVSDAEAAFNSATGEPDGTVLIAGTGSVVGRVEDGRMRLLAGGHGWLLGDEGSAFWIGRAAVRATVAAMRPAPGVRAAAPGGPLARAVVTALLGDAPEGTTAVGTTAGGVTAGGVTAADLLTAVTTAAPIQLARLAVLVSEHADDPAAADILDRAAAHLADLVATVRGPGERTPVVLAGNVIAADTPVCRRLTAMLAGPVIHAGDPAVGAARLALRRL